MSAYSKVNLSEIESSSSSDDVQIRFARKYIDSRDLGVSLVNYAPNYKAVRAHSHKVQEEAYVVIKGSGSILVDNEVIDLKPMDLIRLSPEAIRAFEAGPDGLDMIAVGGPKPEDGDGVQYEALWPNG